MRRAAKVDANQPTIVAAFRAMGASVTPTHTAGQGFPDLVVGYRGLNLLVEVKDPNAPKRDQKLHEKQTKFHDEWRGQICVVKTLEDAAALLMEVAAP